MTHTAVKAPDGLRPPGRALVRRGTLSVLLHRRSALVAAALTLVLAVAVVAAICVGERTLSPVEVLKVAFGHPSPDRLTIELLRLPRAAVGVVVGFAFGVAGALIQTVGRNPLASPDVIGVSQGAAALTVGLLVFGAISSPFAIPLVSVTGGMLTAAFVYVVAWRRGLHAQRFVLIGIGISIALGSLTHLFLIGADIFQALHAKVWLTGSLKGRGWDEVKPVLVVLLAAVPCLLWASRAQRGLSLDDSTAVALGNRLDRQRLGLAALGVVLASVATGAAGSVNFVALVAPQVAARLTRDAHIPLLSAGLAGAVIVVVADIVARVALAPIQLPVGVITAMIGAPYLMWLLIRARAERPS
ncbi:FecCD family ABC transporter permease [Actinomadura alba]|uniref:Iron chelate uptake ABC transporter family permease subunit n=1 Tax=Actinomadura alba TaxID=406431 RepID=A0ABR7LWQ5_9ACTN|nr:iron chelate uptake ABC transporter family permease subunit [Actinomadura alba]MBC6468895.1 iron chelate uptake ABC transporter family permease subunit [Actinomadura alba]